MYTQENTLAIKPTPHKHLTLLTQNNKWVIPYNCELLKVLLQSQNIRADELYFQSSDQCHSFVKRVFLLALEDEHRTGKSSGLAQFGRDLVKNIANREIMMNADYKQLT